MCDQLKETRVSDIQKLYYWLSSQQLGAGSIVEPGTWYKTVSNAGGHSYALPEEVYERIRIESYPDMPSRQRSMYLFDDKNVAYQFKHDNSWVHTDLYEVEVVNPDASQATFNSDLVVISSGGHPLSTNELAIKASDYWSSIDKPCNKPEVLVESSIKIIAKVSL